MKITTSAVCGTDLHLIRSTMPEMKQGTVIGHEAVGEVVETGGRNFQPRTARSCTDERDAGGRAGRVRRGRPQ